MWATPSRDDMTVYDLAVPETRTIVLFYGATLSTMLRWLCAVPGDGGSTTDSGRPTTLTAFGPRAGAHRSYVDPCNLPH